MTLLLDTGPSVPCDGPVTMEYVRVLAGRSESVAVRVISLEVSSSVGSEPSWATGTTFTSFTVMVITSESVVVSSEALTVRVYDPGP